MASRNGWHDEDGSTNFTMKEWRVSLAWVGTGRAGSIVASMGGWWA
ncbi:hypothetical protein SBI_09937 [Streptomyces bingchenggensis BCW-1]|uniref:Uncharacterized protein n=1 Tax=Streptomyces bingchenggensis (strain BCW-1) TaxID=749414 RepID=D7CDL3_STRBB|nr:MULTISPECIES: hypothetical protein [Streptomyces]ADI13055.1 hypothetical protein SBI_09937 [Streptomyces bingchenggensis BCW-1]